MIKKRYIILGIIGIFFYGLFMYEPAINEADAQKYMGIEVNNNKVDINIAKAVKINVDQNGEDQAATVNVADAIKIQNDDEQASINILGVGGDIKETEQSDDNSELNNNEKSEVSLKSDNPMVFRAGNTIENENQVLIDGIGIGELYELNGHDLDINGIKNIIKIKGNCGHVTVDGIANVARIDGASSVTVNGVGNRVYVDGKLVSDNVSKDGILNFVFYD